MQLAAMEESGRRPTTHEEFTAASANNPRFKKVEPSGKGFIIVGG